MIPDFIANPEPEIYLSDNYVVLDYETTNIDKGNPRLKENSLLFAGWVLGPDHPEYTPGIKGVWGDEFHQQELLRHMEQADFIVAQNTKFELGWSRRIGLELHKILPYDTVLGAYAIDGNRRRPRNLNALCARYNIGTKESIVDKLIKSGVCPSEIPKSWLEEYCKKDVELTEKLFLRQREDLYERGLLAVTYTKNIFTPVLTDIENNGMFLDKERVLEEEKNYSKELAKVEQELASLYGEINFNSPSQLAHLVYGELKFKELRDRGGKPIRNKPNKQFPEGQPKTATEILLQLQTETEEQRTFIKLLAKQSKLSHALSTYLRRFKDAVENHGGHIYGKFNQSVTQTHRLSSSGPNFQNFDNKFKRLFTTRDPKAWIGERDEAQLEFRVATFLGDDPQGREDIDNQFDVHRYTASIIFGDPVTDETRRLAKSHTFKPLYGGVSGTDSEKAYYQAFREKYWAITETQDYWVEKALSDGTFQNLTGLMFYHKVKLSQSGYVDGNTNVRNYPIQYLATGEIVPIGVTFMWHYMKDQNLRSMLVNTVHDSAITEEYEDEREALDELSEKAFGQDVISYMEEVYGFTLDVPLTLEAKVCKHWGE